MELLSPAGNLELALAAFDGGADAVYCGLSGAFNARMRAENFTPEKLGKLIRFAHENNKHVYVTLNTLVKENELGSMFETLLTLAHLCPDALIVQDPGVIATAKKYFPELKLHASTQMGIHNSAGVKFMERLGISRVILERQITLDELREISSSTNIELEVFVHGSLCCSLSGRCLLSGFLYGQSGNRGQCKQPCRRRFSASGKEGFFLSPGDLCALSLVEEFDKLGIASLKIEGRLRSPDYVWKTARAYRTLLDAPPDRRAAAYAEAEKILNTALSRRKTLGFYDFPSKKPLIDSATSGVFGTPVAKVEKLTRRGIMITTLAPLHLGDRLRFQPLSGGDGESFSLTAMERSPGVNALKVREKARVFIPGKFSANAGWQLLKIGENGFDFSRRAANLPDLRHQLDMEIFFSARQISVTINGNTVTRDCAFAPAEKHPLLPATVAEAFSSMPEPWCAGKISVTVEGKFFVPAAELKQLRRDIWQCVAPALTLENYFADDAQKLENFFRDVSTLPTQTADVFQQDDGKNIFTIPPFIPERELLSWEKKITAAYCNGCRIFAAEHWHAFELLHKYTDITRIARFPLPLSNSRAGILFSELTCTAAECAPECSADDAEELRPRTPLHIIHRQNKLPLLVSRLPLKSGSWKDRDGNNFTVTRENGISQLFID